VSETFQERRRSPRVPMDGRPEFRIGRRLRVRLLDISANGALLSIDERLPIGSRARLQLLLAGNPFEAGVEVRREEPAEDGRSRLAGVTMASVPAAQQETLDEFLRRAGA
jgi:c-di-GMP-binding flagellar brake protein YcgR